MEAYEYDTINKFRAALAFKRGDAIPEPLTEHSWVSHPSYDSPTLGDPDDDYCCTIQGSEVSVFICGDRFVLDLEEEPSHSTLNLSNNSVDSTKAEECIEPFDEIRVKDVYKLINSFRQFIAYCDGAEEIKNLTPKHLDFQWNDILLEIEGEPYNCIIKEDGSVYVTRNGNVNALMPGTLSASQMRELVSDHDVCEYLLDRINELAAGLKNTRDTDEARTTIISLGKFLNVLGYMV